jgi:hypothetical protein
MYFVYLDIPIVLSTKAGFTGSYSSGAWRTYKPEETGANCSTSPTVISGTWCLLNKLLIVFAKDI